MKTTVTKRFEFCYGHRLPEYKGKCSRFHGHNAVREVTVSRMKDSISSYPDMVMDFSELKKVVEPLVEALDHYDLSSEDFEFIFPPVCENIAAWLFSRIDQRLQSIYKLEKIKLTETPDSWVEVTG